jgi:4-hydroxythreonine-4-phosphate dehydrogenase
VRRERPLAVTLGDPAGIGPEITAKAWGALRASGPAFFVTAPIRPVQYALQFCQLPPPIVIAHPSEALAQFPDALPVLPLSPPREQPAKIILASIEAAVAFAQSGDAAGIVTNPIHKKSLYAAGFDFPGHTEYLGHLTGAGAPPVMMLAIEGLRVVPVTVHLSVADAVKALSVDAILHAARVTAQELSAKFGIAQPRLAVAALNPHAGEGGALGDEEIRIIAPAIASLQRDGLAVTGPHPVDTLFHAAASARYDAVICMLHDHALLPLKTLDFDHGVNITLGLPIIRTSPDHGTAFDIAGKGVANPASLIAAIQMAAALAGRAAS